MSVEQIKREITVLTDSVLYEVTAFLFNLRHRNDPDFQQTIEARLNDQEKSNWLTPEEFECELEKR